MTPELNPADKLYADLIRSSASFATSPDTRTAETIGLLKYCLHAAGYAGTVAAIEEFQARKFGPARAPIYVPTNGPVCNCCNDQANGVQRGQ